MIFHKVPTNENLNLTAWQSDSEDLQLGMRRVMYGIRVSLSSAKGYESDYCVGDSIQDAVIVFVALWQIFSQIDGDLNEVRRTLREQLPKQKYKPIDNDPECKSKLLILCSQTTEAYGRVPTPCMPTLANQIISNFEMSGRSILERLGGDNSQLQLPMRLR